MNEDRELTFGEKLVGSTFNPSGISKVDDIKKTYASIIDLLNFEKTPKKNKKNRLLSIAITEAQNAYIWAVRSIIEKE
jgi:hypothetical protein